MQALASGSLRAGVARAAAQRGVAAVAAQDLAERPLAATYGNLFASRARRRRGAPPGLRWSARAMATEARDEEEPVPAASAHVRDGAATEKLAFQAETRQLLNIVTHSIYTDREVFIRELVSNAADALEKARHLTSAGQLPAFENELEISIHADPKNKTVTIQDNGIGMTRDEMIENLGTIARSGSRAFLQELHDKGVTTDTRSNLIGMFGVGFYSAFMVSDAVTVYSRSAAHPDAPAYCWRSTGSGDYELAEAEGVARGTKIVMHLKDDAASFADKATLEGIIRKYSNFVSFPLSLNGSRVNTVRALWTVDQSEVAEDEFVEFYRYISSAFDNPMFRVHFSSDAPIHIRALFFVGETHYEKHGMGRMPPGVSVYSRKVLIKSKAEEVLPDWMRFFKGVVDSEDLPLSISRENMQDSSLIKKLGNVLTRRLLKFLEDQSKRDPDLYMRFFREYGMFLKEGVCSDHGNMVKPFLARLMRFPSSKSEDGKFTSLEEYLARCPVEQKDIFYLCAPTRQLAEASPYFEAFQKRNVEVIFCHDPIDDFVMNALMDFEGRRLVSAQSADVDLPEAIEKAKGGAESESDAAADSPALSGEELDDFRTWVGNLLKADVVAVKVTDRLSGTPAIVTGHETEAMRRMLMIAGVDKGEKEKMDIELNPRHPLIIRLAELRHSDMPLAEDILHQVFDNAKCAAGILDDPRNMLPRINRLLEAAGTARVGGEARVDKEEEKA